MGVFRDLFGASNKEQSKSHEPSLVVQQPYANPFVHKLVEHPVEQPEINIQPKRKPRMSDESYEKVVALLEEVAALKSREGELKTEKAGHLEQIQKSEDEVTRCDNELSDIHEKQLKLRRDMDGLRDEIFKRDEDDIVAVDESHIPTDGSASKTVESEAKRAWSERVKELKKGAV